MKTIKKKLILAIIATLSLCLSVVTTTYAWFSMNDTAWADEFVLDVRASDDLLIGYMDGEFKQALSNEDIVKAINNVREEDERIEKLSDISLTDVVSFDGIKFQKQEFTYDDNNRASVQYVTAGVNNYVKMRLYFKVESSIVADSTSHRPSYELHFKEPIADQPGIKGTQFTAENQSLTLFNSLTTAEGVKGSGDTIDVNPAYAIRLSVKGDEVDRIIDPNSNTGLGSYAMKDNCETNAMYTYFNNVHGNCLKPMDEVAQSQGVEIKDLSEKLTDKLDFPLGTFDYDASNGSYNTIAIDIAFWIEGFDADNLIGLKTTAMKCLLSFAVREKE